MIDEARWPWRGHRWAHLASDGDLAELHHFAVLLGLHQVSFGGDHYDVTEAQRLTALAAGAEAVTARELVRRLQRSGLRRAAGSGSHRWQRCGDLRWDPQVPAGEQLVGRLAELSGWGAGDDEVAFLDEIGRCWAVEPFELRVLRRHGELALLLRDPTPRPDAEVAALRLPQARPPRVTAVSVTVPAEVRLMEIFISVGDVPIPRAGED